MKKITLPSRVLAVGGVLCALTVGAAEWMLWKLSGFSPLLVLALLQLLPAVLQLLLLLPKGREWQLRGPLTPPAEKKLPGLLLYWLRLGLRGLENGLRRLGNVWYKKKNAILAILMVAAILLANIWVWPQLTRAAQPTKLAYWMAVVVAVLFVVSVVPFASVSPISTSRVAVVTVSAASV